MSEAQSAEHVDRWLHEKCCCGHLRRSHVCWPMPGPCMARKPWGRRTCSCRLFHAPENNPTTREDQP